MTDRESRFTVDPVGGSASHEMSYNGTTIPIVVFDANAATVAVQARPPVTTTVNGLKFFLTESRYWSKLVEERFPAIARGRQPITIADTLSFTTVATEERMDQVTSVADITSIPERAVHIDLKWVRTSGNVTLGPRLSAKMRWDDWLDFLTVHEQFVSLVETGHRF